MRSSNAFLYSTQGTYFNWDFDFEHHIIFQIAKGIKLKKKTPSRHTWCNQHFSQKESKLYRARLPSSKHFLNQQFAKPDPGGDLQTTSDLPRKSGHTSFCQLFLESHSLCDEVECVGG